MFILRKLEKEDYGRFYEHLSGRIRRNGAACFLLRTAGKCATAVMYAAYPLLLAVLGMRALGESAPGLFARTLLVPALSFAALSAARVRIGRPRPYESWDIEPLIPREKKGESMPSRHVFSSAVIAMAWLRFFAPAGAALLLLALLAGFIRVAGGVHYPSDVAVGYLAGVLAGLFLFL